MLDEKVRQAGRHNYGMAERNQLMACPPPIKAESGELVDWFAADEKERKDHFKTVDEQFGEFFKHVKFQKVEE